MVLSHTFFPVTDLKFCHLIVFCFDLIELLFCCCFSAVLLLFLGGSRRGRTNNVRDVEWDDHRELDITTKDAFLEPGSLIHHLLDAKLLDGVDILLMGLKELAKLEGKMCELAY